MALYRSRTTSTAGPQAHPNVSFRKASVYEDLSEIWGRPFDAIIALEVVEHLYDPRQFLRRAAACLGKIEVPRLEDSSWDQH